MNLIKSTFGALAGVSLFCVTAEAEIVAKAVRGDVSKPQPAAAYWANAPVEKVSLIAQPMAIPRPAVALTPELRVQAVHDAKWLAVRLTWKDPEYSEAGHLGEFSDAVAMQFPVKSNESPPPIFMGAKDNPVHIYPLARAVPTRPGEGQTRDDRSVSESLGGHVPDGVQGSRDVGHQRQLRP
jgi:cytochrome b558/566 subunit A